MSSEIHESSPRQRSPGRRRLDCARLRRHRAVVADGPDDATGRDAAHGARPVARHRRGVPRRCSAALLVAARRGDARSASAGTPPRTDDTDYAPRADASRSPQRCSSSTRCCWSAAACRSGSAPRSSSRRSSSCSSMPQRKAEGTAGSRPRAWRRLRRAHVGDRDAGVRAALLRAAALTVGDPDRIAHVRRPHRVRSLASASFCDPLSIGLVLLSSLVGVDHRRAAGPHRDDGRGADDHADDQDAVEPGAAGADLHVRRRDLRRLALGDPAQHSRHAGLGRRRASTATRSRSRGWPAARWASRRRARCWAR